MRRSISRKINPILTDWVINLHQKGYSNDFLPIDPAKLLCIQNGESFDIEELRIILVCCSYDNLTRSYQYIHTIDTPFGYQGLLIMDGILPLNN